MDTTTMTTGPTDLGAIAARVADRADTATGAGWSVVVLCADGRAEVTDQAPDLGTAADIAAVRTANGQRAVIVPTYDAHTIGADLGA